MTNYSNDKTRRGQSYREWKVNFNPTSDECIARGRTHDLLLKVTGLVEETRLISPSHEPIFRAMTQGKDHPSKYWYGNIPIVMIEPYGSRGYHYSGLHYYKLPAIISPYGTCNGHKTQSLLFVRSLNHGVLKQIETRIHEALPHFPDRYHVSVEEREIAEAENQKMFWGN